MNLIEKIVYKLSAEMPQPQMYGWFHIVSILLVVGTTILLCWKCRNCSDKTMKIIVGVSWAVMVTLEIYKQIVFSFNYNDGAVTWDYQWYAFPYQLCSTPIYVLPFIFLLREGKARDAVIAFIGTFAMFGGLVTYIFPSTVFIETIGVNVQTMVHHGLQIVLGIFLLVHERKRLNLRYFLRGIIVFVIMTAIAMLLNIIAPHITSETFNMFFISPYYPCTLPLLDLVYANTPYALFLIIYILGFIIAAFIVYMIIYPILKQIIKNTNKKQK